MKKQKSEFTNQKSGARAGALLMLFLFAAAALFGQAAMRRAPGFCLADTTGQWRDLYDYRGKVVILEFMQTTCPHCAAFVPKLAAISRKYAGKVQILAVA